MTKTSSIDFIPLQLRLPTSWFPKTPAQMAALNCPAEFLLFGGAAGSLKALDIDTLVPTPAGLVPLNNIHVGDLVYDRTGRQCCVLAESPIEVKDCFEFTFDNHQKVVSAHDHLWVTSTERERATIRRRTPEFRARRRAIRKKRGTGKKPWLAELNSARAVAASTLAPSKGAVRTTQEINETAKGHDGRPNHSINVPGELLNESIDLPIPPYVLGAWLGDGTSANGTITCFDLEILEQIRARGFVVTQQRTKGRYNIEGLHRKLRLLGVKNNKHVPEIYFKGSANQRREVLKGLMDTDGTATKRGNTFSNTNKQLALDALRLMRTLGLKPSWAEWRAKLNGNDCGPCYGVTVLDSTPLFYVTRKREAQALPQRKTQTKYYITDVRKVTPRAVKCIAVDSPNHTFLCTESFIPTHNSTTMLVASAQQVDNPRYRAIIFRKSFPEIEFLMDRSIELFTQMGASLKDFNQSKKIWRWPSGARIEFKFLAKDKDIYKYQGPEYQFIGFDESTQFWMEHVRYLINSRGRSIDPSLKQQVFLATNPGNVGHNWHKHVFIGPRCIHCLRAPMAGTKIPGRLYYDATWPDGVPIGHSTCFIPGRVTDHTLYGKDGGDYANKKLRGLSKNMMKALLEGCWEAFEGMYFDIWNPDEHIIPHEVIRQRYKSWWGSWTGTDYGFAHAAASYLFHKSESGRIYVADENISHRVNAPDYATLIKGLWNAAYKPQAWYLSPDAFDIDGTTKEDFSRAQLMAEETGLGFDRAYNERVGGWSLCYNLLQERGEDDDLPQGMPADERKEHVRPMMVISDRCELLIKAIPSAIHDDGAEDSGRQKHRKEDVKKTPDDEDDARDGWRYGVASHVNLKQKSLEQKIAEGATSGDPTTNMIQRLKIEQDHKAEGRGFSYHGRKRTR